MCGVVLPALTTLYMYLASAQSGALLVTTALGLLIGVFSLNYCVLKAGVYRPLTPTAFQKVAAPEFNQSASRWTPIT